MGVNLKECMPLNGKQVENIIKDLSKEMFGKEFNLPVIINGKLTRAFARFNFLSNRIKPISIECSKDIVSGNYKLETVLSILIHELCHWWLYINEKPSRENDIEFKQLVKQFGGLLTGEVNRHGNVYEYTCSECNKVLFKTKSKKYQNPKYITNCCDAPINYKIVVSKDNTKTNLKIDVTKLKSIQTLFKTTDIEKTAAFNDMTLDNISKIINNRKSLTENMKLIKGLNDINDLILPTKTGITSYSVYVGVKYAMKHKSKSALMLIKSNYKDLYEKQIKGLSKNQYKEYQSIINAAN